MSRVPLHPRGISLLEMICAITVLSVIAVTVLPILSSAADNQYSAVALRRQAEAAGFAMDRITRVLRDVPLAAGAKKADITAGSATGITLADGRAFSLSGTDLYYNDGTTNAVLCRNVTTFALTYLGDDGVTSTLADLKSTRRFNVQIVVGDIDLRGSAYARVWMVP
jgi:prepilin-type N-terminal cleavage/methylation domain-containing protein